MHVAAIQMVSTSDLESNLRKAEKLVEEAAGRGAELIVLPENFAVFGERNLRQYGEAESTVEGPIRRFLGELARRHAVWLIGGTVPTIEPPADGSHRTELAASRVYAACYILNPRGEEAGRYDKVHLFDVDVADKQGRYRESDTFQAGDRALTVETPAGKLGLAVCYDIRFPEHFRLLMDQGAEIVVIPSAFTYVTGAAHWSVLSRARAIENLCFVVAACQGGQHDSKRRTWGHSSIVDPWGKILKELAQGEGVVDATLNLDEVADARRRMPVLSHRRFAVAEKGK